MTDIYMSYDNLKRTGQLRNVRVESGFGTVCALNCLCYALSFCLQIGASSKVCRCISAPFSKLSPRFCCIQAFPKVSANFQHSIIILCTKSLARDWQQLLIHICEQLSVQFHIEILTHIEQIYPTKYVILKVYTHMLHSVPSKYFVTRQFCCEFTQILM